MPIVTEGTACDREFVVSVNTRLRVRSGPATAYTVIGYLYNGSIVKASKTANTDWFFIDSAGGWCCAKAGNEVYLVGDPPTSENIQSVSKETLETTENSTDSTNTTTSNTTSSDYLNDEDYYPNVSSYSRSDSDTIELLSKPLQGVFGMPYQFMPSVDRRLKDSNGTTLPYGRIYADKILSRMPILFLSPGRAKFMDTFSKNDKTGVLTKLIETANGGSNDLTGIANEYGRYYTFNFAYADYFKYVNPACRTVASLMGLANRVVSLGDEKNKKLSELNWENVVSSKFKQYTVSSQSIPFYIDSETTVQDSFSNSTGESMLSQKMNSYSELAREASFILGTVTSKQIRALSSEGYDQTLSQINEIVDKTLNGNSLIKRLATGFSTVATGGKLVFPEIWQDSSFSKSYSINMKFRTPDNDPLSIYLNVIVPYIFLICMTAPQRLGTNGYSSPFLVRADYDGVMNIDTGIITDMSVSRGKEAMWTVNGIPTCIDISITIKDLYNNMYISMIDDLITGIGGEGKVGQFLNNTNYMDFLATLVGVNMKQPELSRLLDMYIIAYTNKIKDIPNNLKNNLYQGIANVINNMWKY